MSTESPETGLDESIGVAEGSTVRISCAVILWHQPFCLPFSKVIFTFEDFMKKSLSSFIALSLLPVSSLALANKDDSLTLSNVVVSASRIPQNVSDVYNAVSVITRDDIDRLQATNILDVLSTVPGVTITQAGGKGGISGLFIRGTASAQSLVLIDGVRTAGAASGTTSLETLSVDQIERIEVIRGARSTIYGADAVGGVIQIFTRRANEKGGSARVKVGYGSHNAWERSLGTSYRNDKTNVSLNLSSDEITGHNRSKSPVKENQDDDALRNNSLSLSASHKFTNTFKAGASYLHQKGESEYDFGWMGAYPYDEFELKNLSVHADASFVDNWNSRLELGYHENSNVNLFDDAISKDFFDTKRESLLWLNTLVISSEQSIQIGLDTYNDKLVGSTQFAETERRNDAAFTQYQYSGAAFSTELGLRYDDNEAYGDNTSFNLGVSAPVSERVKIFATYNKAFRAPGFSDLYYPDYSNINLQPEESQNYEVKIVSQLTDVSALEISVYQNDITDAITYDSNYIPQNTAEVEIQGAEVSYTTSIKDWMINANASYVDARDSNTDLFLGRRAKKTANLEIFRRYGAWGFSTSVQGVGQSWDDAANTRSISGYALWNTRVSYSINQTLALGFKVDNILDKDYSTALNGEGWPAVYRGYNELGRTAALSITWTPKF